MPPQAEELPEAEAMPSLGPSEQACQHLDFGLWSSEL